MLLFVGCKFDPSGLGTGTDPEPDTGADGSSTTTGDPIDVTTGLTPTTTGDGETGAPDTTTGQTCADGCPPTAGWTVVGAAGEGVGHALALDAAGDAVVAGDRVHVGNPSLHDIWVGKFAGSDGSRTWEKTHNGGVNGDDFARAVAFDGDGQIVVAGASHETGGGNLDLWVGRFAPTDGTPGMAGNLGTAAWADSASLAAQASTLAVHPNGDLLVGGTRCKGSCAVPEAWVGRFDQAGGTPWFQPMLSYGTGAIHGLVPLAAGLAIVGTDGYVGSESLWRARVRQLDAAGAQTWSGVANDGADPVDVVALAAAIGPEGLLWVVGRESSDDAVGGFIRVYDPLGMVQTPVAELHGDEATAVFVSASGVALVGGSTGEHLWFARFDAQLTMAWRTEADEPRTARGLAIDDAGDMMVLGGFEASRAEGGRLWLRKYVAAQP